MAYVNMSDTSSDGGFDSLVPPPSQQPATISVDPTLDEKPAAQPAAPASSNAQFTELVIDDDPYVDGVPPDAAARHGTSSGGARQSGQRRPRLEDDGEKHWAKEDFRGVFLSAFFVVGLLFTLFALTSLQASATRLSDDDDNLGAVIDEFFEVNIVLMSLSAILMFASVVLINVWAAYKMSELVLMAVTGFALITIIVVSVSLSLFNRSWEFVHFWFRGCASDGYGNELQYTDRIARECQNMLNEFAAAITGQSGGLICLILIYFFFIKRYIKVNYPQYHFCNPVQRPNTGDPAPYLSFSEWLRDDWVLIGCSIGGSIISLIYIISALDLNAKENRWLDSQDGLRGYTSASVFFIVVFAVYVTLVLCASYRRHPFGLLSINVCSCLCVTMFFFIASFWSNALQFTASIIRLLCYFDEGYGGNLNVTIAVDGGDPAHVNDPDEDRIAEHMCYGGLHSAHAVIAAMWGLCLVWCLMCCMGCLRWRRFTDPETKGDHDIPPFLDLYNCLEPEPEEGDEEYYE